MRSVGLILLAVVLSMAGETAGQEPGVSREGLLAPQTGEASTLFAHGAPAADFELTGTYGEEVRLAEFRGRVTALQFWARWCTSCEGDLREFQALHEKYAPRGLVVLGLGHASGSRREVAQFAQTLGITFPMLLCSDEVRSAYEVAVFPTTFLLDETGRIRLRRTGALTREYWERVIEELLQEGGH